MVSNGKRRIKSGKEFDHLFPKPTGKDRRVKGNASVEDTLKLIRETVPDTLWQTQAIAKVLRAKTLEQTCSNIWHFVYDHIQYKPDEDGTEQIRSPRRTWAERFTGVDCDCYTELISSILCNLGIPHVLRITKYPRKPPETPRWQHIYPIVPASGRLDGALSKRGKYIVLDCVKDAFDDEEPFIECKDYDMNLDYLDGIDNDDSFNESEDLLRMLASYREPENVDIADIESVHDSEEMGNIFKKIGNAAKKVADVQKNIVKKTVQAPARKIADFAKTKGVHFINRFTNPGTVLLRNGFLLGVKLNIFNIGGRMRYAYLSDEEAKARGIDMNVLAHVRKIKDKAEKIYYDAGGNKSNFRKAVLKGRGNKKHNPVPLSGLGGFDESIYADPEEYIALHGEDEDLGALGEVATGGAIATALAILKGVAGAFKGVKGLFKKGGAEEASFQSETDNATSVEDAKKETISASDDEVRTDDSGDSSLSPDTDYTTLLREIQTSTNTTPNTGNNNETTNQAKSTASGNPSSGTTVPNIYPAPGGDRTSAVAKTQDSAVDKPKDNAGFFEKTTGWVKDNPGKSLLIAGAIAGGGYLAARAMRGNRQSGGESLSGFSTGKTQKYKKKKKGKASKKNSSVRQAQPAKEKVTFKNLL